VPFPSREWRTGHEVKSPTSRKERGKWGTRTPFGITGGIVRVQVQVSLRDTVVSWGHAFPPVELASCCHPVPPGPAAD